MVTEPPDGETGPLNEGCPDAIQDVGLPVVVQVITVELVGSVIVEGFAEIDMLVGVAASLTVTVTLEVTFAYPALLQLTVKE